MTNENAIVQVIDELSSKLGIAIDWSDENILPYLKDLVDGYAIYMKNYAWFLIITGIVMSILGVIGLMGLYKALKYSETYNGRYFSTSSGFMRACVLGCLIFFGVIGILMILFNVETLIQLNSIPELTVLNDIMNKVAAWKSVQ